MAKSSCSILGVSRSRFRAQGSQWGKSARRRTDQGYPAVSHIVAKARTADGE